MPRLKMTDRLIAGLKTEKPQEDYYDEDFSQGCFGVRVSKTGRKSFFVIYSLDKRKRWYHLGDYGKDSEGYLSLAAARAKGREVLVSVKNGEDPLEAKRRYKASPTVSSVFHHFIERKSKVLARSTYRDFKSMFARDIEPTLGEIKIENLTRRDALKVLNRIAHERGKLVMANRTRGLLISMINFAVEEELCESNPLGGLKKLGKEGVGERFLREDEIRNYWEATEVEEDPFSRVFFRLLLLLALRPGEVMKLRWDYIDGEVLTLPAEITKNERAHELYLASMAQAEIARLGALGGTSGYVFPGHIDGHRKTFHEAHVKMLERMNGEHWTLRDIRRTCETQMRRIIEDGEAVSRVLNHDVSQIRRHYDKNTYFDRKKKALVRWDSWIGGLVYGHEEQKVVALR